MPRLRLEESEEAPRSYDLTVRFDGLEMVASRTLQVLECCKGILLPEARTLDCRQQRVGLVFFVRPPTARYEKMGRMYDVWLRAVLPLNISRHAGRASQHVLTAGWSATIPRATILQTTNLKAKGSLSPLA